MYIKRVYQSTNQSIIKNCFHINRPHSVYLQKYVKNILHKTPIINIYKHGLQETFVF